MKQKQINKELTYAKVYRTLLEWEWYTDINTKSLFIHCLLKVNFKAKTWRGIKIEKGTFLTSLEKLADETGLSIQNVRTSLKKLESTNDITNKSHTKYRIITLNNYKKYNGVTDKLTNNQQTTNKQLTTTKKEEKEEKEKNKDIIDRFNLISDLHNVRSIKGDRLKALNYIIKEYSKKELFEVIDNINTSDYLLGKINNFKCSFDWILKPSNFIKILEGNYNNRDSKEDYENGIGLFPEGVKYD